MKMCNLHVEREVLIFFLHYVKIGRITACLCINPVIIKSIKQFVSSFQLPYNFLSIIIVVFSKEMFSSAS